MHCSYHSKEHLFLLKNEETITVLYDDFVRSKTCKMYLINSVYGGRNRVKIQSFLIINFRQIQQRPCRLKVLLPGGEQNIKAVCLSHKISQN
jgi:hypothetical protein